MIITSLCTFDTTFNILLYLTKQKRKPLQSAIKMWETKQWLFQGQYPQTTCLPVSLPSQSKSWIIKSKYKWLIDEDKTWFCHLIDQDMHVVNESPLLATKIIPSLLTLHFSIFSCRVTPTKPSNYVNKACTENISLSLVKIEFPM